MNFVMGNVATARRARVISITSGKGGAGKTSLAVNLGVALGRIGRKTLIIDGDLGMADAAIMLGLNPVATIDDVLAGRLSVDEIICDGPANVTLMPGGSIIGGLASQTGLARRWLQAGLRDQAAHQDYMLVDTPSGGAATTLASAAAADQLILIISPEPTTFMDAYAAAKLLCLEHGVGELSIVANLADDAAGLALFDRFGDVVGKFLPIGLNYLGAVPEDRQLRDAILRKQSCVTAYPDAAASQAFNRLALRLTQIDIPALAAPAQLFGQEVSDGVC
jgi:flagellar biosynthesis protein FlhG